MTPRAPHASARPTAVIAVAALAPVLVLAGCRVPYGPDPSDRFADTVTNAVDHEIRGIAAETPTLRTTQPQPLVEEELAERRDELEAMGPATTTGRTSFELGQDLTGAVQQDVSLGLDAAVVDAVRNNLAIRIASLDPEIAAEDVIAADAAFDFILYGDVTLTETDEPGVTPVLNGIPLGVPVNASERYRFATGVRKRMYGGGEASVSTDLTRFRDNAPGIGFVPDPAYDAAVRFGLTQPLLRGFGTEVNTASIRFAENAEERAVLDLTGNLLGLVEDVEIGYWDLVLAWRDVEIQQWLVDVGVNVRDVLDRRRDFDTKIAEYADAVARVEQRKADVIRSRRRIRAASDRLKLLINDEDLTVGSEAVLRPADALVESPIEYNLRETILTAIDLRPEVRLALLGMDDARIAEMVAENARLPLLDLSAQLAYHGQDDDAGSAIEDVLDDQFVDYVLGLNLEYPIGNRAAESEYRIRRLQRSQALLAYRQAVQVVVLDVKAALRDVVASFELIQATRSSRVAAAENLRALRVEEETLAGLTPEFLNLKFQRQDGLAVARAEEVRAIAGFSQSLASLHRAMGTGLRMRGLGIERDGQAVPVDGNGAGPALENARRDAPEDAPGDGQSR